MTLARYRGVVLAGIFILVASPLVMIWSWETNQRDQCATLGGNFDFAAMKCDRARGDHPFVPFSERHPWFVTTTLLVGVAALGAGLFATREPRRET